MIITIIIALLTTTARNVHFVYNDGCMLLYIFCMKNLCRFTPCFVMTLYNYDLVSLVHNNYYYT